MKKVILAILKFIILDFFLFLGMWFFCLYLWYGVFGQELTNPVMWLSLLVTFLCEWLYLNWIGLVSIPWKRHRKYKKLEKEN